MVPITKTDTISMVNRKPNKFQDEFERGFKSRKNTV